jgi:hypothetical protein
LNQLAGRGKRVLGLEKFSPAHDRGSSHGRARIIRQAYVPLLLGEIRADRATEGSTRHPVGHLSPARLKKVGARG